jgi:hypothetical protein
MVRLTGIPRPDFLAFEAMVMPKLKYQLKQDVGAKRRAAGFEFLYFQGRLACQSGYSSSTLSQAVSPHSPRMMLRHLLASLRSGLGLVGVCRSRIVPYNG